MAKESFAFTNQAVLIHLGETLAGHHPPIERPSFGTLVEPLDSHCQVPAACFQTSQLRGERLITHADGGPTGLNPQMWAYGLASGDERNRHSPGITEDNHVSGIRMKLDSPGCWGLTYDSAGKRAKIIDAAHEVKTIFQLIYYNKHSVKDNFLIM